MNPNTVLNTHLVTPLLQDCSYKINILPIPPKMLQNFPPFYTKQCNDQVLHHQIAAWHALILQTMASANKYLLTVSTALHQTPFCNAEIGRRLDRQFLIQILSSLVQKGDGLWVKHEECCLVYWKRPAEIGAAMLQTFAPGSICTLWEVLHAPEWKGKVFWGIEQEMMLQVLRTLQAEGKVKLIGASSALEYGIKFI